jgi:glucosamine-6-phosphate deaminase
MDEYIGLQPDDPRRFSAFLDEAMFNRLPFKSVHRLNAAAEPESECARYESLLRAHAPDIVLMGIGENGHIAFNDPPADFEDARLVKIVELDRACRQQQVNDGCFSDFDSVPSRAMTLTVPALVAPGEIICVVPGDRKAAAVRAALQDEVAAACPASALRTAKGQVRMYVDAAAAQLL